MTLVITKRRILLLMSVQREGLPTFWIGTIIQLIWWFVNVLTDLTTLETRSRTMADLGTLLPHMAAHDLRAIASRIGILRRGLTRKAQWIQGIVACWQNAPTRNQQFANLSPLAHAALCQLSQVGQYPRGLFEADYGTVRRPGQQQPEEQLPWIAPQTVSEELSYSGLLHPVDGRNIQQTTHVQTPDFIAAALARVDDNLRKYAGRITPRLASLPMAESPTATYSSARGPVRRPKWSQNSRATSQERS